MDTLPPPPPNRFEPARRNDSQALRNALDVAEELVAPLAAQFPGLGEDACRAALSMAVFTWSRRYSCAGRTPPMGLLKTIAKRELRGQARSESARQNREGRWAALHGLGWSERARRPATLVAADEDLERVFNRTVLALKGILPPDEAAIFRVWLDRCRGHAAYLEPLMDATGMTEDEAHSELPKVKDRLRKRLSRDPRIKKLAAPLRRVMQIAHGSHPP